jgi:hypothetical protein
VRRSARLDHSPRGIVRGDPQRIVPHRRFAFRIPCAVPAITSLDIACSCAPLAAARL